MAGDEFFSGPDIWKPWDTPDATKYGGWTGYKDMKVDCSCDKIIEIKNKKEKVTGCTMSCAVSWGANIKLNSRWKAGIAWNEPLSLNGALGHEQMHVTGAIKLVDKKIVDPLGKEKGLFVTVGECTIQKHIMELKYTGLLNQLLDPKIMNRHRDKNPGDDAFSDMPNSEERYPPLPNSPAIPGGTP